MNALHLVKSKIDGKMEKDLVQFLSCRKTHNSYCAAHIPGNLGRRVNTINESIHVSALVHLNGCNKKDNNFCEHHNILSRELLKRQNNHISNDNALLWQDWK